MEILKALSRSQSFYDRFSFFYPLADFFLTQQKKRMILEVNRLPHGSLLEAGVGNGSHLPYYEGHRITGIDTSVAMLKMAARYSEGVELSQMNAENMSFHDHTFDYIVLSHVIAVVDYPELVLQESFRVLKPGGKLIILNHFTPSNSLRYADKFLKPLASIFHLRSVFHKSDLKGLSRFRAVREVTLGPFSYFKLLILHKP